MEKVAPPALFQNWLSSHIFTPLSGGTFYIALVGSVIFWCLFLFILQSLPSPIRRRLLVVTTFVAGLFYSVEFFWPAEGNRLTGYVEPLGVFLQIMGGFGLGIGIISLCNVHGKAIFRRQPGYYNSIAFFLAFVLMIVASFWQHYVKPATSMEAVAKQFYSFMFDGLYVPLDSTVFSLLAFFIVSAAYRAFRIRSAEASLMMITAFIVMLGQVPIGMALTNWIPADGPLAGLRLERLTNWILTGLNAAAFRAIIFGAMVGYIAMSLRVWLSLEKGTYFEKEL